MVKLDLVHNSCDVNTVPGGTIYSVFNVYTQVCKMNISLKSSWDFNSAVGKPICFLLGR